MNKVILGHPLAQYNKALVTALGVIATGLNVLYGGNQGVQVFIAVLTYLGVYAVPNRV